MAQPASGGAKDTEQPKTRGRSRLVNSGSGVKEMNTPANSFAPHYSESNIEAAEEIGRGSYGIVYKIRRRGTTCAAKKLHDLPLQVQLQNNSADPGVSSEKQRGATSSSGKQTPVSSSVGLVRGSKRISHNSFHGKNSQINPPPPAGKCASANTYTKRADILTKFEKECNLLSTLRHPYIVQFLEVYIERSSGTPVIIMEYLPHSLSSILKTKPTIPRFLQISILYNVALGLAYLHGHDPPIIHRDLTANNILLTSNMLAKIADLGMARILDLTPKRAMQLTQAPGTAAYMPPEALAQNPDYNTKMDVFSFGVLALHLVSQDWPIPTEPVRVLPSGKLYPISEIDRRKVQFDLMGTDHCIYELTTQCLQNDPMQRAEIGKIASVLETLQSKYPLPSTSYLDLLQVSRMVK